MATINSTGAGGNADRLNPTIQTTLGRLGRALTIRDGKGDADVTASGDSVQISPAAASASAGGVGQIGAILADLESLVAHAAQDGAGADVRAEAQRRIDEAVAAISQIAGAGTPGEVTSRLAQSTGFIIDNQRDDISNVKINADLAIDERVDVELLVTQVEQAAGFYLSFGGNSIDLGAGSSFVFQVGGLGSAVHLSFASGTTLQDVTAAINTFEAQTGVRAVQSGTGILINSLDVGADALVTLQVLNAGQIQGTGGIYDFNELNPGALLSGSQVSFAHSTNLLRDSGLDTTAFINSAQTFIIDNQFSASLLDGRLDVSFDVDSVLGTDPGEFPAGVRERVFTVVGAKAGPSFTSNRNELIESVNVVNQALERGETFDVDLRITRAAERAAIGMFLIPEPDNFDVVNGSGVFTISGSRGSIGIVLDEGMTYQEIADRINSFSEFTGAQATASGFAIRIESTEFGEEEFVSVQMLENNGLQGVLSRLRSNEDGIPEIGTSTVLDSVEATQFGVTDHGEDLQATAEGYDLTLDGRRISGSAFGGRLLFDFEITAGSDQEASGSFISPPNLSGLGESFLAFTIHGGSGVNIDGPIGDTPLPGAAPVTQALAGYASSGANAGDFGGALDAIRSLRERGDGGIPPESLAALRRDVIAGAGKSLGINAASDAQRALDLLGGGGS